MIIIAKCVHCDYIDYLNELPSKCPRCNSKIETIENAFAKETLQVKIEDTARRKRMHTVTFYEVGKTVNGIVGKTLDSLVPEEFDRQRLKFMIHAYIWNLLMKEPQLWLKIGAITNNVKDLLSLKLTIDKNRYCGTCKDKGYREKFDAVNKKGITKVIGVPK